MCTLTLILVSSGVDRFIVRTRFCGTPVELTLHFLQATRSTAFEELLMQQVRIAELCSPSPAQQFDATRIACRLIRDLHQNPIRTPRVFLRTMPGALMHENDVPRLHR